MASAGCQVRGGKVIWVAAEVNPRRSGSAEATAALSRQGRYQQVVENLRLKEVKISEHERFVVCSNPAAADRDAATRDRLVARLEAMISDSDRLSPTKRAELRGVISIKPGLARFLRTTPFGLLRVDAAKVTANAHLDGTQVPAAHLLCWLAPLLARIVETRADTTWTRARTQLQRLHVGTFTGPAGIFRQTTPPDTETRRLHQAPRRDAPTPDPAPGHRDVHTALTRHNTHA